MRKRAVWTAVLVAPALVVAGLAAVAAGVLPLGGDLSGLPLAERFERGADWEEFLAANDGVAERWRGIYDDAGPSVAPHLATVRGLPGPGRLLVVTESWCGDTRNTLPYLARLAAESGNLELRIIGKRDAPDLLAAYPSPDGREAIPLVLVLDADDRVGGAWVEQPEALRAFLEAERSAGRVEGLSEEWRRWYEADEGRSALREITAELARAAAGGR